MWITKVSINNPVFATMVMLAIMVLGLFSYTRLGVERMPNVEIPVIYIGINYPGASAEAVETDVTKPVEDIVNTVGGIKKVRSTSVEGRSNTQIEFQLSTNMDRAVQEVRDKIAQVRPGFPKEVKDPYIARIENDNAEPIATVVLSSDSKSLRDLSTLSEQVITKRLQNIAGVAQVQSNGASSRQISINLKPQQMASQHIGVDEILRAIQSNNQNLPAGNISHGNQEQLIRIEGKIKEPRAFGRIIVAQRAGGPVTLDQVAEVVDGEQERNSISRINGKPAISYYLTKTQEANVVEVGKAVEKALAKIGPTLPQGVSLRLLHSDSGMIESQLANVKETILEGAALTMIIVFLFLHSWRSTIITGLTLPISVMASFIAMYAFGFTLNFLTLMALSLCIGLLIDDAIVVRENIVRHLGMGKNHKNAASDGTNEIGLAVMATTFAIVAVFVPVAFMKGMIGRFFMQFGVTVAVAVLVSLFVSFTLDPMLSSVWPDPVKDRFKYLPWLGRIMHWVEGQIERLHHGYGWILQRALTWRKSTLAIAMVLFVGSFFLLPMIGGEMVPDTDNGFTSLTIKTPVGSNLEYTDAKVAQVEAALKAFPEIDSIITTVGSDEGHNVARVNLKLTDRKLTHRRSQQELEPLLRKRVATIAGLETSIGNNRPIFVAILGQDTAKLDAVARELMRKMEKVKGIADIEYSLAKANPATTIKINNELASDLGLSPQEIGAALRPFVAGDTVSHWQAADGQNYDVNVQLPKSGRQKIRDLSELSLASSKQGADGKPIMVPLRQVVEFIPTSSPQAIKRQDLQRRVAIYAGVEGRPAGDVSSEVTKLTETMKLPDGVRFDVGGQAEEGQEMLASAAGALAIAIIFIYLVLGSQFGSFLQPVAIMLSLPLSLIGVFSALVLTGSTLNIFSVIGCIMLMGLVTKNAILLVDFANQGQREGLTRMQALLQAGQVRLRPILMTTLAMVFGMLPMAIGMGDGGELQAPMGRAVIGGVLTSTLLTLVVVPVAYSWLDSLGQRITRWFKKGEEHDANAPTSDAMPPETLSQITVSLAK
jgi:HAE1 family hydrophobic/amphiphilic exporter-1